MAKTDKKLNVQFKGLAKLIMVLFCHGIFCSHSYSKVDLDQWKDFDDRKKYWPGYGIVFYFAKDMHVWPCVYIWEEWGKIRTSCQGISSLSQLLLDSSHLTNLLIQCCSFFMCKVRVIPEQSTHFTRCLDWNWCFVCKKALCVLMPPGWHWPNLKLFELLWYKSLSELEEFTGCFPQALFRLHNLGTCLLPSFQVIARERKQTERTCKSRAAFIYLFFSRLWLIRLLKIISGYGCWGFSLGTFF